MSTNADLSTELEHKLSADMVSTKNTARDSASQQIAANKANKGATLTNSATSLLHKTPSNNDVRHNNYVPTPSPAARPDHYRCRRNHHSNSKPLPPTAHPHGNHHRSPTHDNPLSGSARPSPPHFLGNRERPRTFDRIIVRPPQPPRATFSLDRPRPPRSSAEYLGRGP